MNKEMWKKFVEEPSVDKWFADWLQGEDIPADELGDFKRVEDTQWESKAATYEPFVRRHYHFTAVPLTEFSF